MGNNYEEAEKLMRWKVQVDSRESEEEFKKRIKTVCKKCVHWGGGVCNYLIDTGHQRPCPYTLCKEMGVYERKKRDVKKWNKEL